MRGFSFSLSFRYVGPTDESGRPHGAHGVVHLYGGGSYEGGWRLGKMDGAGRLADSTGSVYE